MSTNAPTTGPGILTRLAEIWADIRYAQLRLVELNRPRRAPAHR
jgi:hypothetical protein